ncbi:hypothetical protein [Amycolatopsis samaneae]|uniref:Uncharacterized protein n=1 Tax=Amycolatopsis samaneae TaxID=664691 RepID=A0ABW5GSA6_9PSEU
MGPLSGVRAPLASRAPHARGTAPARQWAFACSVRVVHAGLPKCGS